VLELKGITKRFGPVHALRGADFALRPGSVHALLGENGAGKSTLMQIAFGLVSADPGGSIRLGGREVAIRSPRDARALGVGMVHQHFTSIGALTVRENIALATGRAGRRDQPESALLSRLREGLDEDALVETLSVSLRQRLEIVKALEAGARILLLDEPTAVLAPAETTALLELVQRFGSEGGSVVLITHKLDEVFAAADHVTVLRHGAVVLDAPMVGQTPGGLAAAMLGSQTAIAAPPVRGPARPSSPAATRLPVLALENATVHPVGHRGPGLQEATLAIRPGEMVGVVAIEGNGQRELMLALAGLLPLAEGQRVATEPVVLVPEDRSTEALIPGFSLTENVVLGSGPSAPWSRGWRIDWSEARRQTAAMLAAYDVRAPGPDTEAHQLSGGNQQKLVLARALEARPVTLLVENPTRGLDLAATAAVHDRLRRAREEGIAVVVYSSDLDEILELNCDRLLVVCRGRLEELPPETPRAAVGDAMLRGRGPQ
jgi:simple sugar transport system ATP-binding protein